jgi:cysteine desulfurase
MIYLDHNATTPVSPEVFEAMCPYFREDWGNPSSSYQFGAKMKSVIETAREQCAALIGAYAGVCVNDVSHGEVSFVRFQAAPIAA